MSVHRHPHAFLRRPSSAVPPYAAPQTAVLLGDGQRDLPAQHLEEEPLEFLAEDLARGHVEDDVEGVLRGAELLDRRQHQLVHHPALEQRVRQRLVAGAEAGEVVVELVEERVGDGDGQRGEDEVEGHGEQHDRGGGGALGVAVQRHLLHARQAPHLGDDEDVEDQHSQRHQQEGQDFDAQVPQDQQADVAAVAHLHTQTRGSKK